VEHSTEWTLCLVRHGQAALSGSKTKAPGFAGGYLLIEKISGRVAYAVMSFGGFLGMGREEHAMPWNKLTYDTTLGGYRTDITEQQLRGAPAFSRDSTYDWNDRNRERELHDYYSGPILLGTVSPLRLFEAALSASRADAS
jgi:hypothetical protein